MQKLPANLLLLLTLALMSLPGLADSQTSGEYTVHYIAVNSTFIDADTAAQYNIVRGKRNAFLNISLLHNNTDGSTTPVTATLRGGKTNLMQQSSDIDFTEIHEGKAIYYIGQFDFSNAEVLHFKVNVSPTAGGAEFELEWSTQLYAD